MSDRPNDPARPPATGARRTDAGKTTEPAKKVFVCDLCGHEMLDLHCKLICERCGYKRDCSDP
ncbi:MAG: hypothetical protein AAF389_21320 [Gemmatimonadota bacterium]